MTNGERMSGVDRAWMRMDRPANPMVVVGLIVLDAPLPRRSLRRLVAERFLCFPRFRCLPITDTIGAHWAEAEQFELDDHLLYTGLPPPAGREQLEAMVGELASTPLNASRPWWSFHLVSGYRGGCALIIRIHHCYADGMALMQVLLSLTEGEETMTSLPVVNARPATEGSLLAALAGGVVPGLLIEALRSGSQLAGQGLHMAMHPTEIGGAAQQAMQVAGELARLAVLPDDPHTQLKQPLSGVKHVAWCTPLAFQEVRTIGRVLGCTVNDVLVSVLAGALGRYLQSQGQAVDGLSIRATVPTNLRSDPATLGALGNQFGLVFLELPIGIRHPFERLVAVHEFMGALKASSQAIVTYGLLAAIGNLPTAVEEPALALFSAKASLVASNVAGPRQPRFMAGIPVSEVLFWVPQTGSIGIGVSIFSYCDQVQLGVIADRELIPRPGELLEAMRGEFERLVLLVLLGAAELKY